VSTAYLDFSALVFGSAMGLLWLFWTGRLLWIAAASLRRRAQPREPPTGLSISDLRFLRNLHIRP
jgi:hypothetical protein